MSEKLSREDCVQLLNDRASQLGRIPVKSDFTSHQIMMIKSYFGPWPRALEASGLKVRNAAKIDQNGHAK